MSKKPSRHGPNKAKSIVAQPLFRSRQERPAKGKGSYRRVAKQVTWAGLDQAEPEGAQVLRIFD